MSNDEAPKKGLLAQLKSIYLALSILAGVGVAAFAIAMWTGSLAKAHVVEKLQEQTDDLEKREAIHEATDRAVRDDLGDVKGQLREQREDTRYLLRVMLRVAERLGVPTRERRRPDPPGD